MDKAGDSSRLRGEMLRFAFAGVLGLGADVAALYCAMALGLGWYAGRAVSFCCAVWVTWQFNRRFTFTRHAPMSPWQEWWRYVSAMLGGGIVNYAVYSLVVLYVTHVPFLPLLAVAAGSSAGMVVNFVSAKYLVFHRPS